MTQCFMRCHLLCVDRQGAYLAATTLGNQLLFLSCT